MGQEIWALVLVYSAGGLLFTHLMINAIRISFLVGRFSGLYFSYILVFLVAVEGIFSFVDKSAGLVFSPGLYVMYSMLNVLFFIVLLLQLKPKQK